MKNCIKLLFLFTLIFALVIPTVQAEEIQVYNGSAVIELDKKGNQLKNKDKHVNTDLYITNAKITESNIELLGTSKMKSENELAFQITGELLKSRHTGEVAIGNLKDELGNFEVLFFSIDSREKDKGLLFDKKKNKKGNIVKLYLLDHENNFLYFELNNPVFLNNTYFEESFNLSNHPEAEFEIENWYSKVLEPVEITSEEVEVPGQEFQILNTRKTTNVYKNYIAKYTVLGENVYENIQVRHYVAYDDYPANLNVWTSKMSVTSKWTSSVIPDYNGQDSSMEIGRYSNSLTRAKTSSYEGIDNMSWAANGIKKASYQFYIQWKDDWSMSLGPVNFGAGYSKNKSTYDGNSENFYNSSTIGTRTASSTHRLVLNKVGHAYDTIFSVGKFGGSGGSKTMYVEFVYDVSCLNYYPYGGTFTVPLSATYYR